MSQINRAKLKALRVDIDAALKAVGEKHNVQLRCDNVRYNDTNASFKLEVSTVSVGGEVVTRERTNFIQFASMYGLNPNVLDKEFDHGDRYKVIGLNVKAHKYPVLVKNLRTGRVFKYEVSTIKSILGEG